MCKGTISIDRSISIFIPEPFAGLCISSYQCYVRLLNKVLFILVQDFCIYGLTGALPALHRHTASTASTAIVLFERSGIHFIAVVLFRIDNDEYRAKTHRTEWLALLFAKRLKNSVLFSSRREENSLSIPRDKCGVPTGNSCLKKLFNERN